MGLTDSVVTGLSFDLNLNNLKYSACEIYIRVPFVFTSHCICVWSCTAE